nr:MAG TPA: hypothetical protein [Caudoviricetes sp.]
MSYCFRFIKEKHERKTNLIYRFVFSYIRENDLLRHNYNFTELNL